MCVGGVAVGVDAVGADGRWRDGCLPLSGCLFWLHASWVLVVVRSITLVYACRPLPTPSVDLKEHVVFCCRGSITVVHGTSNLSAGHNLLACLPAVCSMLNAVNANLLNYVVRRLKC